MELDFVDRSIISALTKNSRSSATELSESLGVSRATIQNRINKLVQEKVIARFTIELGTAALAHRIEAIMLIAVQGNLARRVIKALKSLPEVSVLHTTNGSWDLIAQIEAHDLSDFDRVLRNIREIEGVTNSDTSIQLTRV